MPGPADLAARFEAHADAFEAHLEATSTVSNPSVRLDHPSMAALVALGDAVAPLAMERYRTGHLLWGAVIAQLMPQQDFGDGRHGDLRATRQAWLAWWDAR